MCNLRAGLFVLLVVASSAIAEDALEKAEQEYNTTIEAAKIEFDSKCRVAKEKLVPLLKAELSEATKRGDLDRALKLRDRVRALEGHTAASEPAAAKIAETPRKSTAAAPKGEPFKPIAQGEKTPATLYLIGDDNYQVYVNGRRACSGSGWEAQKYATPLGIGDVVTVRANNTGGGYGFAMVIKFKSGNIITSTSSWKSYTPKSETDWFKLEGITEMKPVVLGTNQDWKKKVKALSEVDCDAIWNAGGSETVYLVLQITGDSVSK
ncbi:MAG TPA: hypothetical protein VEK08_00075 [Planctomycetota bacterium]|nr:hypothetical protein [Planctomycetota bacterium]